MPVKIRLMRIGARKKPFYRVVAVDERKKRTGEYLDLLGTYNPLTNPKEINLKQDKIDGWVSKGAVMSVGFLRIIGKAPKRLPRKPKKEKAEKPTVTEAPKPDEQPIVEEKQPVAEEPNTEEKQPEPAQPSTEESSNTDLKETPAA